MLAGSPDRAGPLGWVPSLCWCFQCRAAAESHIPGWQNYAFAPLFPASGKKTKRKKRMFLVGESCSQANVGKQDPARFDTLMRTLGLVWASAEEPMLVAWFCDIGSGLCSRDLTFAPSCFIILLELRKTIDLESTVTLLSKYSTLSWSVTVSDNNKREIKS